MFNLNQVLSEVASGIVKTAGIQVAAAPEVKQALDKAQAKYDQLETLAWIGIAAAGLTFTFYVMPRMENPIPRVLRRKRS